MKIKLSLSGARSQKEMTDIWNNGVPKKYSKYGTVLARLAKDRTKIITTVNGKVETQNHAEPGDVIVTNPGGEQYVLSKEKFKDRYTGPSLRSDDTSHKANGSCYAFKYAGEPLSFMAAWGEAMILNPGDYLCSPTKEADGDIYRIEGSVFPKTYR